MEQLNGIFENLNSLLEANANAVFMEILLKRTKDIMLKLETNIDKLKLADMSKYFVLGIVNDMTPHGEVYGILTDQEDKDNCGADVLEELKKVNTIIDYVAKRSCMRDLRYREYEDEDGTSYRKTKMLGDLGIGYVVKKDTEYWTLDGKEAVYKPYTSLGEIIADIENKCDHTYMKLHITFIEFGTEFHSYLE